jgi:acyl carrier protein
MSEAEVTAMKARIERLIYIAAGGRISQDGLSRDSTVDLRTIGLDSLGYLNLLEGLERTFGVTIDLDAEPDHTFLHTIDGIVRYVTVRQGEPA